MSTKTNARIRLVSKRGNEKTQRSAWVDKNLENMARLVLQRDEIHSRNDAEWQAWVEYETGPVTTYEMWIPPEWVGKP